MRVRIGAIEDDAVSLNSVDIPADLQLSVGSVAKVVYGNEVSIDPLECFFKCNVH